MKGAHHGEEVQADAQKDGQVQEGLLTAAVRELCSQEQIPAAHDCGYRTEMAPESDWPYPFPKPTLNFTKGNPAVKELNPALAHPAIDAKVMTLTPAAPSWFKTLALKDTILVTDVGVERTAKAPDWAKPKKTREALVEKVNALAEVDLDEASRKKLAAELCAALSDFNTLNTLHSLAETELFEGKQG